MSRVLEYIPGVCRNQEHPRRHHMYAKTSAGHLWPMCDYGWNRSNGGRFSILRGWTAPSGCKVCEANIEAGKRPIVRARPHKTKWL